MQVGDHRRQTNVCPPEEGASYGHTGHDGADEGEGRHDGHDSRDPEKKQHSPAYEKKRAPFSFHEVLVIVWTMY